MAQIRKQNSWWGITSGSDDNVARCCVVVKVTSQRVSRRKVLQSAPLKGKRKLGVMNMDRLTEMEAFFNVVDQGDFTEAARKMGIYAVYPPGRFTQPKVRTFIGFLAHAFAQKGPSKW